MKAVLGSHILLGASLAWVGGAINIGPGHDSPAEIKQAVATIANGLYVYHNPNSTAGQFVQIQPWYWWLSGNAWSAILDYMVYTGDTKYKADFLDAMTKNVGPNFDFVPPEQQNWEANDDQMYWAWNAMTALEYNFQALPCVAGEARGACRNSWLPLVTNAFELFVRRWDVDRDTCNGGLRWQFDPKAKGYRYKNAVTNGGFFQTAARLARYTGNQTYADWAGKIWDWSSAVGLVSKDLHVLDGTSDDKTDNCTSVNSVEWTYNIATYLHGTAHMYALTGDDVWRRRAHGLVDTAETTFFGPTPEKKDIMYEKQCERTSSCGTDQTAFKSSLARWMSKSAMLVPSLRDKVSRLLCASAVAAAQTCVGYANSTCGMKWWVDGFDGRSELGVQLSALDMVQSLLVANAPPLGVSLSRMGHLAMRSADLA